MEQKRGHAAWVAILAAIWLGLSLWAWLRPETELSVTERRELQSFPSLSVETVLDGTFTQKFEKYTQDQFPCREVFRRLKAQVHYNVFQQRDNHGVYLADGYAAKLDYPLNSASVAHALSVFQRIYTNYLQDSKVYFSLIPDKGYYLGPTGGYPTMDYEQLEASMRQGMPYASYVNLTDLLTEQDYYRTDTHWRQERLLPVAQRLCAAMGSQIPSAEDYSAVALQTPFYGVYYGQAALPVAPDVLYTMESDILRQCKVYNYETAKYGEIYDMEKAEGEDLYEVFLSGSVSLLTIENPNADAQKELIVFRDSFGSALSPLLVEGYGKVTLVDVRYMPSVMLERFLDFHGQDVLFLYSATVLNNSFQLG